MIQLASPQHRTATYPLYGYTVNMTWNQSEMELLRRSLKLMTIRSSRLRDYSNDLDVVPLTAIDDTMPQKPSCS